MGSWTSGRTAFFSYFQMITDDVVMLRQRLLAINKEIRKLSKTPKYLKNFEILTSTPGIGLITAMTLLTEVGDIRRFKNFSQFNSFIGLYPSEFSSGEKILKGKMTKRSHKAIRSLIIEAAWIAIGKDPTMALKYKELTETKTGKRAIVVIARKLLNRIYTIWNNQQTYVKAVVK